MGLKRFLLGAGIGFIAGALLQNGVKKELISPEKALRIVKRKVSEQGVVEGSWIHMIPESYEKQFLQYEVYRGGISATIEGEFFQFDFVVDAETGSIIELTSQNS